MRIVRMQEHADADFLNTLLSRVGNSIDEDSAMAIVAHLKDRGMLTDREALLMRSALQENALSLPINAKDILRAAVMRNMLRQVFKNQEGVDAQ